MTADLASTGSYERHPFDWYVEPAWTVAALIAHVPFDRDEVIYDPACGRGTIPLGFRMAGFRRTLGTDIVDRGWLDAQRPVDFLEPVLFQCGPHLSIVCNPPYSYKKGIAEAFVSKALASATRLVCMLLPVKWLASEGRHRLFSDHAPSEILIFCERPSMPPGELVEQLGQKAWKRGKVDYCWIVWDVREPFAETRTRWIAPRPKAERA